MGMSEACLHLLSIYFLFVALLLSQEETCSAVPFLNYGALGRGGSLSIVYLEP